MKKMSNLKFYSISVAVTGAFLVTVYLILFVLLDLLV